MTPINPAVLESLNWGISTEIKSYVFYLEAAKQMANDEYEKTLLKLAEEEKGHYRILERQHHSLITSEQWVSYNDILNRTELPEIDEDMADRHKELLDTVKNAKDELQILNIAFDLEKEAYEMFSGMVEKAVEQEEKNTFTFLAGFEKGHMNIIQKMIDSSRENKPKI